MADFWYDRAVVAPQLANYAIRLATTVANTTISERGFSSLNRIQTRLRNRLTLESLGKLIFININAELLENPGISRTTKKRKRLYKEEDDYNEVKRAALNKLANTVNALETRLIDRQTDITSLEEGSRSNYLSFVKLCK
jgi:hypothetical protein